RRPPHADIFQLASLATVILARCKPNQPGGSSSPPAAPRPPTTAPPSIMATPAPMPTRLDRGGIHFYGGIGDHLAIGRGRRYACSAGKAQSGSRKHHKQDPAHAPLPCFSVKLDTDAHAKFTF